MPGNIMEMDYVYAVGDSLEFRNARVLVAITDTEAVITIVPEQAMDESELNGILESIEADTLKKIKMSLTGDCRVVLMQNQAEYAVSLMDGMPRVKEMKLVG